MTVQVIDAIECAMRCAELGWKSTATASTLTSLTDTSLVDQEADATSWGGIFLYVPGEASAADKQRRVLTAAKNPYSVGVGTLAIAPGHPWSVAPTGTYYASGIAPIYPMPGIPYSWMKALSEGLRGQWYVGDVVLGTGDGNGTYDFPITTAVPTFRERDHLRRVRLRRTINDAVSPVIYGWQDANKNNRWTELLETDNGVWTVRLHPSPSVDDSVVVSVAVPMLGDTDLAADATTISMDLLAACALTRMTLFRRLNGFRSTAGKYQTEFAVAQADYAQAMHQVIAQAKGS